MSPAATPRPAADPGPRGEMALWSHQPSLRTKQAGQGREGYPEQVLAHVQAGEGQRLQRPQVQGQAPNTVRNRGRAGAGEGSTCLSRAGLRGLLQGGDPRQ